MKTVFTNNQLPHIWIKQTQFYGKGSNMFFEGDVIYSYGYHFPIAKIYNIKDEKIVLFTAKSYSNTTAKHKSDVRSGIDCKHITLPDVLNKDIELNINYFIKGILEAEISLKTTRTKMDVYLIQLDKLKHDAKKYIKFFDIKLTDEQREVILKPLSVELSNLINAKRIKAQEAERKKQENKRKEQEEALNKWLSGANVGYFRFIDTRLRIKDNYVESTHGAKVKVENAKALYSLIKQGKDVVGYNIEGYTVIGINGTLKIGCHNIPIDEVHRIGSLL